MSERSPWSASGMLPEKQVGEKRNEWGAVEVVPFRPPKGSGRTTPDDEECRMAGECTAVQDSVTGKQLFRSPFRTGRLAGLLLAVAVACSDQSSEEHTNALGEPTGVPCPLAQRRPEVIGTEPAGVSAIVDSTAAGCHAVARLVAELNPLLEGKWPDPSFGDIAQDSRGRVYSGSGWNFGRGSLVVWAPNGDYLRTIGRLGEGPGEFPLGELVPIVGREDSLFVISRGKMTVFAADYTLARVIERPPVSMMNPVEGTCLLEGGSFVSVGKTLGAPPEHRFHVMDGSGNLVRSFGSVTAETERIDAAPTIACTRRNTFWAVSDVGVSSTYVLEEWRDDGTQLRRLIRTAEWWPAKNATLRVTRLHLDSDGNMWVVLRILPSDEESPPIRMRYEIVTLAVHAVIVTAAVPEIPANGPLELLPPIVDFVRGANRGVGYRTDAASDLNSVLIYDLSIER